MWKALQHIIQKKQVIEYKIYENDQILSYAKVIDYWINRADFRSFYTKTLTSSSFEGFYWENPSLIKLELDKPYEFTLTNSPSLSKVDPEPNAFREHFNTKDKVVVFPNLRGDATLVVPTPENANENYCHLARFLRNAPTDQIDLFWCTVGMAFENSVGTKRKWLSTAGMGVYWLHARIDSSPKYYRFKEYTNN